jgi:hypothetical protein
MKQRISRVFAAMQIALMIAFATGVAGGLLVILSGMLGVRT